VVLRTHNEPWIAAESTLRSTRGHQRVSSLMVRHVADSRETLVLSDAANLDSSLFARDPYVKSLGLRSVLVSPIIDDRDAVIGVFVAENLLLPGAFNSAAVQTLNKLLPRIAHTLPLRPTDVRRASRLDEAEPSTRSSVSMIQSAVSEDTAPQVQTRGFLTKRGAIIKSWKRRYFILKNRSLSYYETPDAAEAIKGIPMSHNVTVELLDIGDPRHKSLAPPTPHCIVVISEGRSYFLCADDGKQAEMWTAGIKQHLERKQLEAEGVGSSSAEMVGLLQPSVGPALEDLRLVQVVGQGGFAVVYKGTLHGTTVAVKRLCLDFTEQNIALFRREAKLMSEVRHPNILLYMGARLNPPEVFIITEFMPRGSLYSVLQDPTVKMTWQLRVKMATDAASGMLFLHSVSPPLIHRDLKTENLLVDAEFRVKVSDFGLTRLTGFRSTSLVPRSENTLVTSNVGSIRYSAPEVLAQEHFTEYNEKADCYAFGMVLWEMVSRKRPFFELPPNRAKIEAAIKSGQRPSISSQTPGPYATLTQECWHEKPLKRPNFQEILARLQKLANQV